jgi:hypothetical protein
MAYRDNETTNVFMRDKRTPFYGYCEPMGPAFAFSVVEERSGGRAPLATIASD